MIADDRGSQIAKSSAIIWKHTFAIVSADVSVSKNVNESCYGSTPCVDRIKQSNWNMNIFAAMFCRITGER